MKSHSSKQPFINQNAHGREPEIASGRQNSFSSAHRILKCVRYGIGDLIMETPILDTLRMNAPQASITALGSAPATELLEVDPAVDRVVNAGDWGLTHWYDEGGAGITETIAAWLERMHFDVIADPSHATVAVRNAIHRTSSAQVIDTNDGAQSRAICAGLDGLAAIRQAVALQWGVCVRSNDKPRVYITLADEQRAESLLRARNIHAHPRIALSPAASSPLKRWPPERYAALADLLLDRFAAKLLLLEGPGDTFGLAIASAMRNKRRATVISGAPLRTAAGLLARSSAFVCNDTGLMHLAAAMGTPVAALFGPTSPRIYLPSYGRAIALGDQSPCAFRKNDAFGPPLCVLRGQCQTRDEACILAADLDSTFEQLYAFLSPVLQDDKEAAF